MNFPELETARLKLDQLVVSDTKALFEIFSDPEVIKFYDVEAFTKEEQATKLLEFFDTRLKDETGIRWAIRLKENNQLIGTCGFNSWNNKMKSSVIGYEFSSKYWGKGYATEMLHKIISTAFAGILPYSDLHRIQGDTMIGNLASESVLTKVGFKEEGIRRQSGFWKGQFHDLKCFGLLKPEYKGIE